MPEHDLYAIGRDAGGGGAYRQAIGVQVPQNAQPEEQQRDRGDSTHHWMRTRSNVPKYARPRSWVASNCYCASEPPHLPLGWHMTTPTKISGNYSKIPGKQYPCAEKTPGVLCDNVCEHPSFHRYPFRSPNLVGSTMKDASFPCCSCLRQILHEIPKATFHDGCYQRNCKMCCPCLFW